MKKWSLAALLFLSLSLHAQTDVLIEVDTGRKDGSGASVAQRAILTLPPATTDTVLLHFRGNPGYAMIKGLQDKVRGGRTHSWMYKGNVQEMFMQAGIAFALVDCPTDQWGQTPKPPATNCLNDYRGSKQAADDVRRIMAQLKEKHGFTRFYILGHSIGTVPSRWLAINLGKDEVAGIIHSATINNHSPRGPLLDVIGYLTNDFPRKAAGMPMLHLHHENDGCNVTPYDIVRRYAKDNLVTVRGGVGTGDPCAGHLHSYEGREDAAGAAVIAWIKTGKVETYAGSE